jgi:23S rRNA pseudouridine2605 synthase
VDGRLVVDPLTWVELDRQHITRRGRAAVEHPRVVLAMNKPRGVVTTRRDERGRRTVYELLPAGLPWVFPAGRLDADSDGLLILTNDSRVSARLTDPHAHVPKTYRLVVRGRPHLYTLDRLRSGLLLHDGPTRPAQARLVVDSQCAERPDRAVILLTLTEGRNRQARRMLAAVGHPVCRLTRIAIGGLELAHLPQGQVRPLDADDVARLWQPTPPFGSRARDSG